MDRINSDGVFRAIGRPAPSTTWRQETLVCDDCGQPFEAKIATVNGEDRPHRKRCDGCEKKCQERQARLHALSELNETISHYRNIWFENSGLFPSKFSNKSFEDFDAKLQRAAFNATKRIAEEYCHGTHDEPVSSLVLLSPDTYGVGKTHLAAALVNYIINTIEPAYFKPGTFSIRRRRQPVFVTNESTLLARIRATFNAYRDQETEEEIFHKLIEYYDVLVIDDVGKVRPRDYNFLQSVYFRIVDGRYMGEVPLILTTNLGFSELEKHIGGANADRLREMCGDNFIVMKGRSYRHG